MSPGLASTDVDADGTDEKLVGIAGGGDSVDCGVMRELVDEVDLSRRSIRSCDTDLEDAVEVQESNLETLAEAEASLSDHSISLLACLISSLVCSSSKLVTHSLTKECHWPWGPSR